MPVGIVLFGRRAMAPNPLARARRLGAALLALRERHGYTHAELSGKSGVSASVISRLENPFSDIGRTPNLRLVRKLLDALGVERGSDRWAELEGYAEDVAGGWWDEPQYADMGQGQRDAAILEYGATVIRQYSGLLLPGLVQTAAYARRRVLAAANADAIVAGRLARQHVIESAEYELVFEVQAVRRYPVPPAVMVEQLHHLLDLGRREKVSIRVARMEGQVDDGATPRGPFAHITYSTDDPRIVAVDNVTGDMLVTDAAEVAGYADLHKRVCEVALSNADSAAIITEVAERLAAQI